MKLSFIGAVHDVTGSMTLIQTNEGKFLVDAGLYQGLAETTKRNLNDLPFNPKEIDAIFLTHAHLDHCGFIPRLTKLGFRGSVFCTSPTMKLANIIMRDSAHILEETKNHLLQNFYSPEDAAMVSSFYKKVLINKPFLFKDLEVTFMHAGHILGASFINIKHKDKSIIFSGDLGRSNDPLLLPPESCPVADVVVMESTYGSKIRQGDMHEELDAFIRKVKTESKVGIIASFAVARAQNLISLIYENFEKFPGNKIRLVIDGPMMNDANTVYREYSHLTLTPEVLSKNLANLEVIEHTREWESLKKLQGPLLIITSSGMVTGGRIWRHLENWQDDPNAVLFLPGYQGAGTPGKALASGERKVKSEEGLVIHWSGEVVKSEAFSSHADQSELIQWLGTHAKKATIYLNHGEHISKVALQKKLNALGYECFIADDASVKV